MKLKLELVKFDNNGKTDQPTINNICQELPN